MNRIYKVIWSKVKHQYVVTSEFAHSCTKSTGGRISRSAAAVLAALVLTMGVGSVQANYTAGGGWIGDGRDNSISIGDGSNTYDAPVHADNAIAIGHRSFIGADANGSIAIGVGATVTGKEPQNDPNAVAATNAIAIGNNAKVSAEANNSVAFGANSKATEANTFSIGSEGNERRLVNLAEGKDDNDGATYGQVKKVDAKADTAQKTADTALTHADTAQKTADTALTHADTAQKTADTALTH
ncbi:ESPR-type extended signal peptide-containing protein, partial [uncultured Megasphaera sp.]|uniref:ESPR-type extended signal peptide-containing protein n=1 Tax=uncultured Megasphaera sp. TaxID=165188 RepID=UPI0025989800